MRSSYNEYLESDDQDRMRTELLIRLETAGRDWLLLDRAVGQYIVDLERGIGIQPWAAEYRVWLRSRIEDLFSETVEQAVEHGEYEWAEVLTRYGHKYCLSV